MIFDNADVEECCLLGCDGVYYIKNMLDVQVVLIPASSFIKCHEDGSSKRTEISVHIHQSIRHQIPKDSCLHSHRNHNLTYHC